MLERYRSAQLVQYRDVTIEVGLGGYVQGEQGVLVAHGDAPGGYLVFVEDGTLHVLVNSYGRIADAAGALPPGTRLVRLAITATPDLGWHLRATADDAPVATLDNRPTLIGMAPWTGISVGVDAHGPVSWELRRRHGTFRYTGDLRAVTYRPGRRTPPQ